uniref:uncharacterized protein LOC122604263 n=1 Tax=Erigeron canadensis TaxID=72917 RepID=UPI001CB97340|nr:uncharacterized protein LOC122604263 [Erigeron canadensis]
MREFQLHVDADVEFMGGAVGRQEHVEDSNEDPDVDVLHNDEFESGSDPDDDVNKIRNRLLKKMSKEKRSEEVVISKTGFHLSQTFGTSKEVKDMVKAHAIETRRELKIAKNDKERVRVVCEGKMPVFNTEAGNPEIPSSALQGELQRRFELGLSKKKAQRAKRAAQGQLRGDYTRQYNMLRDYVLELHTSNPGSTIKLEVEPPLDPDSNERIFKRIYVCLVAYALVEAETKDTWTWFLECLGDDLDLDKRSNYTFMSDRQKGIIQAIAKVFPCVEHRYCLKHIHENMKLQWRGTAFKNHIWKCAIATTVPGFNKFMLEFKNYNEAAYNWLLKIPPQHWARSHFTGRAKSDVLLNNMCEVLNSKLVKGRAMPIIHCLEFIREYLMIRIDNVHKVIAKSKGPLTPTATRIFELIKTEAESYKAIFNGTDKYQVSGPWEINVLLI